MPQKRPHILVLDGAPEVLDLFRELLEAEGYRVSLCLTASASVEFVKHTAPDLVVLDLVLSDRDAGQRLLWELRKEPATAGIVILVCTGVVHLLEQALERMADDGLAVIQKPFDIDVLLETIAGCLRGARRHRSPVAENGYVPSAVVGAD